MSKAFFFVLMEDIKKLYAIYKSCKSVEIDSRKIKANQLFFAFKGEHTDGHQYVKNVLEMPGCYAVVDNPEFDFGDKTIRVENTLDTLQELARYHRDQFDIPVLALTGSNGKTTTKELILAVLETRFKIHATQGNYNNHIGVPLTLLSASDDIEIMIIEMGANRLKDIEELCEIADPDLGLITNIGTAHIGSFGSQENIIQGKTEIYRHIASKIEGKIFINKYDKLLLDNAPENTELILYPDDSIEIRDKGMYLELEDKTNAEIYNSHLTGIYNGSNMQTALAVGTYFGVDRNLALQAISRYISRMNRSELKLIGSVRLLLDAYNANPTSMKASLESFDKQAGDAIRSVILGDMLELGKHEIQYHRDILDLVSKKKFSKVILIGPLFMAADSENAFENYLSIEDAIDAYKDNTGAFDNSYLLLKASRSLMLEKFVSIFEKKED